MKKYLIGFVLGVVSACTVSVIAATYFASSDVTYDNGVSGLKSENVQDAIDELYTECTKEPTAGETIIENASLEKDPYECRYFFTGENPNNYITFNNEKAKWRIISVECDGAIKIMKIDNINTNNNLSWDTSGGTYGSNNWKRPADLNTYLNGTYYTSLNSTAQSQIVAKDWSIGPVTFNDSNIANTISDENATKWNGKVALVTASEYVRSNSNKSSCGTVNQLWNATSGQCKGTTWMFYSSNWWLTLSPSSSISFFVFYVHSNNGNLNFNNVDNSGGAVRPVVYLSSEITLTGSGTQSDPYTIE